MVRQLVVVAGQSEQRRIQRGSLQQQLQEVVGELGEPSAAQRKVWDRLTEGIDAYLDVCLEPAYARIVIQEAPAVLGNARYREIDSQKLR